MQDFVKGVSSGVVDVFVQPYLGARSDGARGFATGIPKGAIGAVAKTGHGLTGLYSHTATGVWRSIHAASHSKTKKGIMSARRVHDMYFSREAGGGGAADEARILQAFNAV